MREPNRSREDIVASILEIVLSPEKQTIIMYKANLSFSQLKSYMRLVQKTGLAERIGEDRLWMITDKGREYLQIYGELKRLMEPSAATSGQQRQEVENAPPLVTEKY